MNYFSRPYRSLSHQRILHASIALLFAAGSVCTVPRASAQASGLAGLLEEPSPILHSSSQGYLGVLVGDVDPMDVQERAAAYTPVPGGVGPLTISMLMANTVAAAEAKAGPVRC